MDHRLRRYHSFSEIAATKWRKLEDPQSPFADWEFLLSLEEAHCVGAGTGWNPIYLTLWSGVDQLVAAVVCYVKEHSYGEYIFDWEWAKAAQRASIPYYPKLLVAVPFTPSSCNKLLIDCDIEDEEERDFLRTTLIAECQKLQKDLQLSSCHFLFTTESEQVRLNNQHFLLRTSFQYHWFNNLDHRTHLSPSTSSTSPSPSPSPPQLYENFDHFLSSLKSRKAKQMRKERKMAEGIVVEQLIDEQVTPELGKTFYDYYLLTIDSKQAIPYLNQKFFELIFARMSDRILVVKASEEKRCLALSLFFYKGSKLYGRYWGSREYRDNLHFELCYYQGIEFAIANKMAIFEAGAQGEHKIARGFIPTLNYSAHDFQHAGLKQAIGPYLENETKAITDTIQQLNLSLPFK
jgi:predicted N-acyltransferase